MSFAFRKLTAFEASMNGLFWPTGAEWLYRIERRMPDWQKFASFFWVMGEVDRKAAAFMVKAQKDEMRRITDAEWKPRTTNPDTRPGSEGKRDA